MCRKRGDPVCSLTEGCLQILGTTVTRGTPRSRLARPLRTPYLRGAAGRSATRGAALGTRVRGCSPGIRRPRVAGARPRGSCAQLDAALCAPAPALPLGLGAQAAPRLRPHRVAGDLATYWGSARTAPRGRWRASGRSTSGIRGRGRLEERPPPRWSARRGAPGSPRCRKRAGHVRALLCSRAGGGTRGLVAPPLRAPARPLRQPSPPATPAPGDAGQSAVGSVRPPWLWGPCTARSADTREHALARGSPSGSGTRGSAGGETGRSRDS